MLLTPFIGEAQGGDMIVATERPPIGRPVGLVQAPAKHRVLVAYPTEVPQDALVGSIPVVLDPCVKPINAIEHSVPIAQGEPALTDYPFAVELATPCGAIPVYSKEFGQMVRAIRTEARVGLQRHDPIFVEVICPKGAHAWVGI